MTGHIRAVLLSHANMDDRRVNGEGQCDQERCGQDEKEPQHEQHDDCHGKNQPVNDRMGGDEKSISTRRILMQPFR